MLHTENVKRGNLDELDEPRNGDHSPEAYQDPVTGAHFRFKEVCMKLLKLVREREKKERFERASTQDSVKELSEANTICPKPESGSDNIGLCFNSETLQLQPVRQTYASNKTLKTKSLNKYSVPKLSINGRKPAARRDGPFSKRVFRPLSLSPVGIYSARSASKKKDLPVAMGKRMSSPRPEATVADKRVLASSTGLYHRQQCRASVGAVMERSKRTSFGCIQFRKGLSSVFNKTQQKRPENVVTETEKQGSGKKWGPAYNLQTTDSVAAFSSYQCKTSIKTRVPINKRRAPPVEMYHRAVPA